MRAGQVPMFFVLERALRHVVQHGTLIVIDSAGEMHSYGNNEGRPIMFRIASWPAEVKIALYPEFHLGESYMNSTLVMEQGTIGDLLALFFSNLEVGDFATIKWPYRVRRLFKWQQPMNSTGRARRNVAHHYDLSGALYDLFLGTVIFCLQ